MADKFFDISTDGNLQLKTPITLSAGAADAGKLLALDPDGHIHPSALASAGSGYDVQTVIASEALAVGDYVNIYNDTTAGGARARKADASTPSKAADGFVKVVVAIDAPATIYYEGVNQGHLGLTPGTDYFLSATTPGGVETTPPTVTGTIIQRIGKSVSATEIHFEKTPHIVRA